MDKVTNKPKIVFAALFLVIMVVFGTVSVSNFVYEQLPLKYKQRLMQTDVTTQENEKMQETAVTEPERESNDDVEIQRITPVNSYKEIYPFYDDGVQAETGDGVIKPINNAANYIASRFWSIDYYTSKLNPLFSSTVKILNVFERFNVNQNVLVIEGVPLIKLSNGIITQIIPYSHPQEAFDNILDFSVWLKSKGIEFLTVLPAYKFDDSEVEFPKGIPHGYSQMIAEYKSFMEQNQIDYLDAKTYLLKENNDFFYWFYKTDMHWNAHSGLLIAGEVSKYLKEKYGLITDEKAVKQENFTLTVCNNGLTGDINQKFDFDNDDFEIFYPKNNSVFSVELPRSGIIKTGSFEKTMLDQRLLTGRTTYSVFLYGDKPLMRIENKNCNNGTRILVIKKSFANIMNTYLSFAVQYLDIIDSRHFDGSIRSFIEQTRPDAVITCDGIICVGDEDIWRLK